MASSIEFVRAAFARRDQATSGAFDPHLSVSTTATAALALYQRMGFVTWGTEPAAMEVRGRPVAEHHMTLVR